MVGAVAERAGFVVDGAGRVGRLAARVRALQRVPEGERPEVTADLKAVV